MNRRSRDLALVVLGASVGMLLAGAGAIARAPEARTAIALLVGLAIVTGAAKTTTA